MFQCADLHVGHAYARCKVYDDVLISCSQFDFC